MEDKRPSIDIDDVKIYFPFKPYKCQKRFMEKVIECLNGSFSGEKYEFCKSNGLLESPTGTGKTLTTLCTTLAWLNHNKERLAEEGIIPLPKIVFATRTHSQIKQVVKEIKNCAYHPKVCVLSSRKQLCVNISGEGRSSEEVRNFCLDKVRTRKCPFYHISFDDNVHENQYNPIRKVDEILDIEELCEVGKREKYCPYYYQRKIAIKECEVIVLPYNYLVNPGIKKSIKLDLSNSIIIFDEAHNLEKVCESLSSFQFNSYYFVNSINELDLLVNVQLHDRRTNMFQKERKIHINKFKEQLVEVEKRIINIFFAKSKPPTRKNQDRVLIMKGHYFAKILEEELDISHENSMERNLNILYESRRFLREMKVERTEGIGNSARGISRLQHILNQFLSFTILTKPKMKKYYRFIVTLKPPGFKDKGFSPKKNQPRYFKEYKDFEHFQEEEIPFFRYEFFCLSPTIAMKQLLYSNAKNNKSSTMVDEEEEEDGEILVDVDEYDGEELPPKCIILISGTLSPLSFFEKSFEVPFTVRLQNSHAIEKQQLSSLICSTGPARELLSSEFKNRSNPKYISEICDLLVNVCRLVPNGVLVFFPSFRFLDTCITQWKIKEKNKNKTWFERLENCKKVFHEPTNTDSFSSQKLSEIIISFEKEAEGKKGALLLAVCRGRLSEGLDFRDNKCRMVVVVGIPYPPRQDLKVQMKEAYYQSMNLKKNEWYSRQASSAVNQAIGRVIRHSRDYGMILLCDSRYTKNFHISNWITQHKKNCKFFGEVASLTSLFFRKWKKNLEETVQFRKPKRSNYGGKESKIILNLKKVERMYTISSFTQEEENEQLEKEMLGNEIKMKERSKNNSIQLHLNNQPQQQQQQQQPQQKQQQQQQQQQPQQKQQQEQQKQPQLFIGKSNIIHQSNNNNNNKKKMIYPPPSFPIMNNNNNINNYQKKPLILQKKKKKRINKLPPQIIPPLPRRSLTVIKPPPPNNNNQQQQPKKKLIRKKKRKIRPMTQRSGFLEELRCELGNEEYEQFKSLLLEMKDRKRDFEVLASEMIDLIGKFSRGFCEKFSDNLPESKKLIFKEVWRKKDKEFRRNKKKRKREEAEEKEKEKEQKKDDDDDISVLNNNRPMKKRKLDNEFIIKGKSSIPSNSAEIISSSSSSSSTTNSNSLEDNNNIIITSPPPPIRKPPESKCVFCKNTYKIPFSSSCGHVACKSCWEKWLPQNPTCPICRKKVKSISQLFL